MNYRINSSNEIIIFKQYFASKDINIFMIIVMLGLFFLNFINKEFFAVNSYHKYKLEELEIRNNLKLGVPTQNEFHIENEVSIFFGDEIDDVFYDVEALIFGNNQFIKSLEAEIEVSKKNFNLIFYKGERLSLNSEEKSKTNFDKFIYSIKNDDIEKLLMDKEHFNTRELLNHSDKDFISHGHNRIIQYLFGLSILFLSLKIIFMFELKRNSFLKFSLIFSLLLLVQIMNSYFIYLLNDNKLTIISYYFLNLLNLSTFILIIYRLIR